MSKNQVGSSILWGASIDISTDVSVDIINTQPIPALVGSVQRVYTGRTSTDVSQYIDRDIIGTISTEAYRSNTSRLPLVYWSTVGPVSVASQETVDR